MEFDWDAANTKHIRSHRVTPAEAEQAILIDPLVTDIQRHETEDRVLSFGRTAEGRLIAVLYTERRGRTRVITAYPMTRGQRELYFKSQDHANERDQDSEIQE